MVRQSNITQYHYGNAQIAHTGAYLIPSLLTILQSEGLEGKQIFELGCGNGALANELVRLGYKVTGVDPSAQGIALANKHFPHINLFTGSSEEDLASKFGTFPA